MTGGTNEGQSVVRGTLLSLYEAAVAVAHPDVCLPSHLPLPPPDGQLYVVGAGKAAAAMAVAAQTHYRALDVLDRVGGFVTAPHGSAAAFASSPQRGIQRRTQPASRRPSARWRSWQGRRSAIGCWCSCPAAPRRSGRRRRLGSPLLTRRSCRARFSSAAPTSTR